MPQKAGAGLVLASKSPRRRDLFALISPHFQLDEAGIDEDGITAQSAPLLAERLAREKAEVVFARRGGDVVIGCDTVVELDGHTLGKPHTPQMAEKMLKALSGRRHFVHTSVAICAPGQQADVFAETTVVEFAAIPQEEILAYIQTDEPYDKAGGYGIQGWAARHALRIEGCYYNAMGLPVARLYHRLLQLGLLPRQG